ncbi:MAG: NAD(P)-binding domain-containing protein, partial [Ilumatobacter sp.]
GEDQVIAVHQLDHVVLERGQIANSWRTERWDSLRLLTPNWMTRLPGGAYRGADPDGFMSSDEVVALLDDYGSACSAPILTNTVVERVTAGSARFDVMTDQGTWAAKAVVVATGACSQPNVPALADVLPRRIHQLTALEYRNPSRLGTGQVLVVGASASGAQIADELQRSGRQVTLAVGSHVRLPRTYRGRDIHWWLDAIGQLDERYDEVDDIDRARRQASLQLVGGPERRTLDLNALVEAGVRVVGKLAGVTDTVAQFSGGLGGVVANADLKQRRLLDRIDEFVSEHGLDDDVDAVTRPARTQLGPIPTERLLCDFETVVWATGHRPTYPWLDPAALDRRGRPVHDGGIGAINGMYFLGLPFMRRRKSSFIDGVGPDATDLTDHLRSHLDRCA